LVPVPAGAAAGGSACGRSLTGCSTAGLGGWTGRSFCHRARSCNRQFTAPRADLSARHHPADPGRAETGKTLASRHKSRQPLSRTPSFVPETASCCTLTFRPKQKSPN
jgi:hypothetical protein